VQIIGAENSILGYLPASGSILQIEPHLFEASKRGVCIIFKSPFNPVPLSHHHCTIAKVFLWVSFRV
jgi:hypothetical protein